MEIIRTHGIDKKYDDFYALQDVSISINKGTIFGLLGPNGAGKTTLIRIINQITAQDKGELLFNGRKMKPEDAFELGYLPEERGLYQKMKVGEQALYLAQLKGLSKHEAMERLKHWFIKFDMTNWWNKKVEELSKGMQQKLQFITTIIHQPALMIFDEPFSGFDPINTNLIKNEILNLKNQGATIIFSTHNMGSVEELCDDIALINKAKNILNGPIREIRNEYKPDILRIHFQGHIENAEKEFHQANYEIIEERRESNDEATLKVKSACHDDHNHILSRLIPHGRIVSFNEVMPSMNDIFIEVVENQNHQETA